MNPDEEMSPATSKRMDEIVDADFLMLKSSMTSSDAHALMHEILTSAAKRLSIQQDLVALACLAKKADRLEVLEACETACHALSVIGAIDKVIEEERNET